VTVSKNQIELKTGTHWIENHCVHSAFFIPNGCPMIDSRMIREHIEALDHFLDDNLRIPFLIDLTSSESVLSFDALKSWGQSSVLNAYRSAEVYVVDTLADLIFLKQHIRLNKLDYPARVFQSLNQAKDWLIKLGNNHQSPI
jgi:hypothetical protein